MNILVCVNSRCLWWFGWVFALSESCVTNLSLYIMSCHPLVFGVAFMVCNSLRPLYVVVLGWCHWLAAGLLFTVHGLLHTVHSLLLTVYCSWLVAHGSRLIAGES